MNGLEQFLSKSYTPYQAVENAKAILIGHGFLPLAEEDVWDLKEGGKYFVTRGGSLITFRHANGPVKIVASHTDSPCLKLKENACMKGDFTRLNVEEYGGAILYSFFDRPLKLAGRVVRETEDGLRAENFVSDFSVCIPSLAVHMNRGVNEGFSPDRQTDLLPVLSLGERDLGEILGHPLSYDVFAVPAEEPFQSGADGEFLSSPRIDNLSSVYASLMAISDDSCHGACLAACFDSEEIGSRTAQGAGGDFLRSVLTRLGEALHLGVGETLCRLRSSFLISLDNAHSVHPNRPEKCDPTNRAVMGGGVVIKGHAGGAYTTDALSSAVIKKIFRDAGVKFQTFFNRSDMKSGGTLGAISLTQASIPSVDLGIAQLAMHSAVETMARSDFSELMKGLTAYYASPLCMTSDGAKIG